MANHNFCPSLDKYFTWIMRPFGWLLGSAVCSLLIGLFVGPQGYVLCFSAVTILMVGIIWPWISVRNLRCQIRFTEARLTEGESMHVCLEIENRLPITIYGLVLRGDLLDDLTTTTHEYTASISRVGGWSVTEFTWEIKPARRGVMPGGCLQIGTGFPFGIYQTFCKVIITGESKVWPQTKPELELKAGLSGLMASHGKLDGRSGLEGEIQGIREFRQGDLMKQIHWGKSARYQQFYVKERQSPDLSTIQILLDLNHASHEPDRQAFDESLKDSLDEQFASQICQWRNSYEWAIRMTATICKVLLKQGVPYEVIVKETDVPAETILSSRNGIEYLLDRLAILPAWKFNLSNCTTTKAAETNFDASRIPPEIFVGGPASKFRGGNGRFVRQLIVDGSGQVSDSSPAKSTSTKGDYFMNTNITQELIQEVTKVDFGNSLNVPQKARQENGHEDG